MGTILFPKRGCSGGPHPTVSSALPLLAQLHRESAQVRHRHPSRSELLVGEGRHGQERPRLLIDDPAADGTLIGIGSYHFGREWVEPPTEQGQ